jgi:dsDNA-specific endonuclease/ATPase MutS2
MTNADSRPPKPSKNAPSDRPSDALSGHPDNRSEPDPFTEPVVLPLEDVLDLHSVPPRDAHAIVEEYLHECYRQNFLEIRIIHGRGIGVQRAMVRSILERLDFVESFSDAPMEAGGWGATVVTLRKTPTQNREYK